MFKLEYCYNKYIDFLLYLYKDNLNINLYLINK